MLKWIDNYLSTLVHLQKNVIITDKHGSVMRAEDGFKQYVHNVQLINNSSNKLIFIGNGGSAGVASHLSIDHTKNGQIRAIAFNDSATITCLANDYSYEDVFSKQIEYYAYKNDILIAISSSGQSKNILKAVKTARMLGCKVFTYSGFNMNNPLRLLGDLNFYINSKSYGFIEIAHLSLCHAMLDYIMECMAITA